MGLPGISEYIETLSNPAGLFRTLKNVIPEKDARGNIRFFAGNNAAVFPVSTNGKKHTIKCYIKPGLHSREVYDYFESHPDPLYAPTELLEKEIFVYDALGNGDYHDVTVAEWTEGVSLETEIKRTAREYGERRFTELSTVFDSLALEILDREWAHGDLKPENIIVLPDGSMKLIDLDAAFIPGLSGKETREVGTPSYQHPGRNERFYCKEIDDYSITLISVSLHALALDSSLFEKYHSSDNIILYPQEIVADRSEAYDEILELFVLRSEHRLYNLARSLSTPAPAIPGLKDFLSGLRKVQYKINNPVAGKAADIESDYRATKNPLLFENKGLWGYRLPDKTIIPAMYERASEFSDGLASVYLNNIWQVIDSAGEVVINGAGFEEIKPFSEDMAAVKKSGKWGYIDKTGKIVIPAQFEMAGMMHEKRAVVRINRKYGYIDPVGKLVIQPIYEYATGFSDGKALVNIGEETFQIDYSGNRI